MDQKRPGRLISLPAVSWCPVRVGPTRMEQIYRDDCSDSSVTIDEYSFVCTCCSYPEQYDMYADGVLVAYVRLRSGRLTACRQYPDLRIKVPMLDGNGYFMSNLDYNHPFYSFVYTADWNFFLSESEKMFHLREIIQAFVSIE